MNNNEINPLVAALQNDVMGFLNEIQLQFPNALSLASGRPDEHFFNVEESFDYFNVYTEHIARHKDRRDVINSLGQYNKAKGFINDVVAQYLKKQYGIPVDPSHILINVGTQEGIMLSIMTFCNKETDVIAVENPTYVGITDYSKITGHAIQPLQLTEEGICLEDLREKLIHTQKKGKRIKLVYVTPDFQNPTGICMPLEKRKELLSMAETFGFYIVEDNAYGDFLIEGEKLPTIKSLDTQKRVIYLHSLSKILYPSLRLGILVADQTTADGLLISDLMAKVKGYTTVNTPAITQAVFAGILLKNKFDLRSYNEQKLQNLVSKRNAILDALEQHFRKNKEDWSHEITWNAPKGGFFLTMKTPVAVTREDVYTCAKEYNVIFTPMSFFYLDEGGQQEIRLAYSYISLDRIHESIRNLAAYLKAKLTRTHQPQQHLKTLYSNQH